MATTLIRGGTVVTEEGRTRSDVLVREGVVAAVGEGIEAPVGADVIDAGGCFVLPGGVDPHTHMQLPTMGTVVADDFATGTAAAAAGGTTTILDFVGPERGQSPAEALGPVAGMGGSRDGGLWVPHDGVVVGPPVRCRDGAPGARPWGRELQVLPGLQGRPDAARRGHRRGLPALPGDRGAGAGPRGERRAHRVPPVETARRGQDRARGPRALAAAAARGRGDAARDHHGRGRRRAPLRGPRLRGAGGRGHRRCAEARRQGRRARPCPGSLPSTTRFTQAPTSTWPQDTS